MDKSTTVFDSISSEMRRVTASSHYNAYGMEIITM